MKLSIFSVATLFACGCTAGQIAAVNSATSAVFTVEQEACVLANQSLLGTTTAVKDLEIACPAIAAAEPFLIALETSIENAAKAGKPIIVTVKK